MSTCGKIKIISALLGWILPTYLPILHVTVLWLFWSKYHFPVDSSTCTCECWDSIFKGPYESGWTVSYKNFYFNSTRETLKIWILISTGAIILFETSKQLVELMLRGKVRFSMLALFVSSIFPHYYSWWVFINYLNDAFYEQWYHQLFYTLTEGVSTILIITMANVHRELSEFKLLVILAIATVHLISGGIDQFVVNVILMKGAAHQVIRDFGLMIPDVLHIIIPLIELIDLKSFSLDEKKWYKDKIFLAEILFAIILVFFGCFLVFSIK